MIFGSTLQQLNRIKEVVQILLRYGFEDMVTNTQLKKMVPKATRSAWVRAQKPVFEHTRSERIRMVIEELGPTFVKLAQVISNRPDLLPDDLIKEFQKLQDNVPPFAFKQVEEIIQKELGTTLAETFEYFDEKPLGSASIGQVHRARLKDGDEVVVKVRRPGVVQTIETDLILTRELVRITENYFIKNGILNPLDIVDTFEKTIKKELNYTLEARNIGHFRSFYQGERDFYVPKAYKIFTTERVLVLEFVRGCKITDVEKMRSWGLDPKKIAERGMDIYLRQIFEFGYFHADPHPGNVLVRKDGVLCLIDFGMIGRIMKKDKYAFAGIFISMGQQNARSMALNFRRLAIDSEIEDMLGLERDLNELIEEFAGLDLEELNMSDLAGALQKIIFRYRLKVPGGIFLILRALVILEGIGKTIYPGFRTFEFVIPYGAKLQREQFSLENMGEEALYYGSQLLSLIGKFPSEIRTILSKVRKGNLQIQVENRGYEPVARAIRRTGTNLVLAGLTGILVIAASITLSGQNAQNLPSHWGYPIMSLVELASALVLLVTLIISLMKNGTR